VIDNNLALTYGYTFLTFHFPHSFDPQCRGPLRRRVHNENHQQLGLHADKLDAAALELAEPPPDGPATLSLRCHQLPEQEREPEQRERVPQPADLAAPDSELRPPAGGSDGGGAPPGRECGSWEGQGIARGLLLSW